MQQKLPCDFCGQRPFSTSIVAYHRWYNGNLRYGYKQRMCFKCAEKQYGSLQSLARGEENDGEEWPETCPACGEGLGPDIDLTYTSWFRGKTRRETCLPLCVHCAANARTVMMNHAEALEDRQPPVGEGGAPRPNLLQSVARDELPW